MKRRLLCLLLCVAMLLTGCDSWFGQSGDTIEITFYYRAVSDTRERMESVIQGEQRTLENGVGSLTELLQIYFTGPISQKLQSPFPQGLEVREASLDDGILALTLSREFSALRGINLTIATACIVYTMEQLEGVEGVMIATEDGIFSTQDQRLLHAEDYILLDTGMESASTTIRLYHPDAENRYLIPSDTQKAFASEEEIPYYIISQIMDEQGQEGMLPIPRGTVLRNIQVSAGLCTVDFSQEFLDNRPEDELEERMLIYGIINALTWYEGISSVQILVEGNAVGRYVCMDLSQPIEVFTDAVGPVRAGLDEFDATLYLPFGSEAVLAAVPVCIRASANKGHADLVAEALLDCHLPAGYWDPIPEGTKLQSLTVDNGVCYADFSEELLEIEEKEVMQLSCIRSIVASLASLEEVDAVQITVDGEPCVFLYADASQPLTPQADWFFSGVKD